jgi:hypothetical protein
MANQVTLLRVFVASPGGLEAERALFRQALHDYNESDALERHDLHPSRVGNNTAGFGPVAGANQQGPWSGAIFSVNR